MKRIWVSGFATLFALGFLLMGCGVLGTAVSPTVVPLAEAPNLPTNTPVFIESIVENETAVAVESSPFSPTITVTPTDLPPPTPDGTGVRPNQVEQLFVPSADNSVETDETYRPPPFQPPLAYHPNDHYWFIRPIPSGFRNYDLEWYPYGNDVLLTNLPKLRIHHGIDLPNEPGTPILAAASGTVIYTGTLPSPRDGINYYGNTVIIQHDWQWRGKDVFTLYAHTLEVLVNPGDYVEQGQVIAGVGGSGAASGPHLHFEVRIGANNYGETRNPALWIVPYEGYGTLAGRLVDRRGNYISSATISLRPLNANVPLRTQETYDLRVRSDEAWEENFVMADLPAGDYEMTINAGGNLYRRDVTIYSGQTTYEVISTLYDFVPTAVPEPTATPEETPESPDEQSETPEEAPTVEEP